MATKTKAKPKKPKRSQSDKIKCKQCGISKTRNYFFGNSPLCRKCGYEGKGYANAQTNGTSSRRLKRSKLLGVEAVEGIRNCTKCDKILSKYNPAEVCHACDGRFVSMNGLER